MNITEPQAGPTWPPSPAAPAPGRRQLPHQRPEDLHHLRRPRHGRQHRHLVLARTPTPAGVKGLSLFMVPKFIPRRRSGNPGEHNDVYCTSIEHKLGVHGSPTTTLVHGDHGGSTGYLIGELGRGLEIMFVMMNSARLSVGTEGLASPSGLAARLGIREGPRPGDRREPEERRARRHRPPPGRAPPADDPAQPHRGDPRPAYTIAALQDVAHQSEDAAARDAAHRRVELLTPVLKGWSTESAVELTSMAIQIFGGMGFVGETGIAIHARRPHHPDLRRHHRHPAADLAGRKIARDGGQVLARRWSGDARRPQPAGRRLQPGSSRPSPPTWASLDHLEAATGALLEKMNRQPAAGLLVAEPYLKLLATVVGGWLMGKAAHLASQAIAGGSSDPSTA